MPVSFWFDGEVLLYLLPVVLWVFGNIGIIWWVTSALDNKGGKMAARILMVPGLLFAGFCALLSLPFYGAIAYVLMVEVSVLLAPFVALAYLAPVAMGWVGRHMLFRRPGQNEI